MRAFLLYTCNRRRVVGSICISDPPRSEAHEAIQLLRESGIDNIIMLTGDHEGAANALPICSV